MYGCQGASGGRPLDTRIRYLAYPMSWHPRHRHSLGLFPYTHLYFWSIFFESVQSLFSLLRTSRTSHLVLFCLTKSTYYLTTRSTAREPRHSPTQSSDLHTQTTARKTRCTTTMATLMASRPTPSGAQSTTVSNTAQSHPYTCNTCQVAFRNSDLQRGHMRNDWQ